MAEEIFNTASELRLLTCLFANERYVLSTTENMLWMSCCISVEQPECGRSSYLFCFLYRRKVRDGENCNDIDGAVGLYVYVSRERERERERLS